MESEANGVAPASPVAKEVTSRGRRRFDLGGVVGLVVALIGVVVGAQRLSDNSFFTHLATGREMVANGFVHQDVFTWTSQGRDLVVQSWLASLVYGLVEGAFGFAGLRVLTGVLAGLLAWLVWQLGDSAPSLHTRLLVTAPVLVIAAGMWSERPLLMALVLFAITLRMVRGGGRLVSLMIVGFLWIGVHGSWPLGIVLLLARAVGGRVDGETDTRDLRAAGWLAAGILAGGILNPYGLRLLMFPFGLLGRGAILSHVVEWQSPSFDALYARAFLAVIILMIVAITKRWSWRNLLPAIVFLAAALVSRRNISVAALVAIPVMADGLPPLGRLAANEASAVVHRLGLVMLTVVAVSPILVVRAPNVDLSRYPVEAVNALEAAGMSPVETHVLHPDFVGNYLELRYGGSGAAWLDDRYELHESSLMDDYLVLFEAGRGWSDVLDRSGGEAMIWPTDHPLTQLVSDVAGWPTVWSDSDWTVLCDPTSAACRSIQGQG